SLRVYASQRPLGDHFGFVTGPLAITRGRGCDADAVTSSFPSTHATRPRSPAGMLALGGGSVVDGGIGEPEVGFVPTRAREGSSSARRARTPTTTANMITVAAATNAVPRRRAGARGETATRRAASATLAATTRSAPRGSPRCASTSSRSRTAVTVAFRFTRAAQLSAGAAP